jgi:hypothetical protein
MIDKHEDLLTFNDFEGADLSKTDQPSSRSSIVASKFKHYQPGAIKCQLSHSWECGVIIPIPTEVTSESWEGGLESANQDLAEASVGMDVFNNGHIPVPMVVPGDVYGARRPWFFNDNNRD